MPARRVSFFKDVLGKVVLDDRGRPLGRVQDVTAALGEAQPPIRHLLVAPAGRPALRRPAARALPWSCVRELGTRAIRLDCPTGDLPDAALAEDEVCLRKGLMDQQVVDNRGAKLVRVNDLILEVEGGALWLVGIETGLQGLLVRLGSRRRLVRIMRLFGLRIMESLIRWEEVERFEAAMRRIRLRTSREMLRAAGNGDREAR